MLKSHYEEEGFVEAIIQEMSTDLIPSIMPGADFEDALSLARNKSITCNERLTQFFKAEINNRIRGFRMWGKGRDKNVSQVAVVGRHGKYCGRGRGRRRGNAQTGRNKLILTKVIEGKRSTLV